jgi:hypothetical protein
LPMAPAMGSMGLPGLPGPPKRERCQKNGRRWY